MTTYDIGKIQFGVYSEEELLKMSVCEVTTPKLSGKGSVYDERLGVMDNDKDCVTCHQSIRNCPGHFGYIKLNQNILFPIFSKYILLFLKCFCFECFNLLVSKDHIQLYGFHRLHKQVRIKKIVERIEKNGSCYFCNCIKPKIIYSSNDDKYIAIYKTNNTEERIELVVDEVKRVFDNISDESIRTLGLDPKMIHPRNLVLSVFPILPPIARPFVISENIFCDDDLTTCYTELIKVNNHLLPPIREVKQQKYSTSLKFRIKTLIDNSQQKAKHSNGRPIKSLKQRISGKDGLIRNNLMGKRVNQSARTVIGADPTLKLGELAIPEEFASILTIPETVNEHNKEFLENIVNNNQANFVIRYKSKSNINLQYALYHRGTPLKLNDIIIRNKEQITINSNMDIKLQQGDQILRNGKLLKNIIYPHKKHFTLHMGDVVQRHLRDGDYVLLNRQPTLHRGSMMAHKVVIKPHKTFRFSLASCASFNSDFDGDEMNIHVPQSYMSKAELSLLSTPHQLLINPQSTKPNITVVQDGLLGAYLMTKGIRGIRKEQFWNIFMKIEGNKEINFLEQKIQLIRHVMKKFGKSVRAFTGKGLVSLLLPDDFNFTKRNDGDSLEPIVKIYRGVLYEGTLTKSVINGANGLIHLLSKEYDTDTVGNFIDNIQFIATEWLLIDGFSIGIKDCLLTKRDEIRNAIHKCFLEATIIAESTQDPIIKELRMNASLGKAKDVGMRIAKDAMVETNNFISTVKSGSKGDFFNIAQITGLVGQQNIKGGRFKPTMNRGKRTLPHYHFETLSQEREYESKGFIKNSFMEGLNPREFFFHACSGREGITDTAMRTAESGYNQRKIVKIMEDIQVQYDGTIRNSSGHIIEFSYGNTGLDYSKTVNVDGKQQVADVARIVDRLNLSVQAEL